MPVSVMPGPHGAPREQSGSSIAGEILLTPKGTLGLRGPMVPIAAYAPPQPVGETLTAQPPRDYVDTGYAARLDRPSGAICITAPPSGIMTNVARMRPSLLNPLFAPVTSLPGVGPKQDKLLQYLLSRSETPRLVDLLLHLPSQVIDRRARPKIRDAVQGTMRQMNWD